MNRFFNSAGSKENPPRMVYDAGDAWYLVSRPQTWEDSPHGYNAGDCCWWTALAAMTYPEDRKFLEGLKELSPIKGEVWRRHPFGDLENTARPVDDFTRDHLILGVSALAKLDYKSAVEAIDKTKKFRISQSTFSRLDLYLWLMAIKYKDKFWGKVLAKLFSTTLFIQKLFGWPLDRMAKDMMGKAARQVHPNDLKEELPKKSKLIRVIHKTLRPKAFANHLDAWKVYTLANLGLGKSLLAGTMIRAIAGRYNYLISMLTGKKINKSIIKDYKSREGWIWQTYIDHSKRVMLPCTDEEAKYNAMDKDLLWVLYDE